MEPVCITETAPGNNQLLYFTSPSLCADDRLLVYLGDRTGHPNLFVRDLATGVERALTHNTEDYLWSYVYFDGRARRGLGKASVSLDAARGLVYHIQGDEIRVAGVTPSSGGGVGGESRFLARVPAGQVTAFTHVSEDGSRLCVPTIDARALEGFSIGNAGTHEYDIDTRVRTERLSSYLRVYDTATGQEIACERVPSAWVTHVQFSPRDPSLILYNHEWASKNPGLRRMWLWDGREHRALRTEGEGRRREDWVCHEMWERDGSAVVYHGGYVGGRQFLGRICADGTGKVEIPLPEGWKRYGHFTVGGTGQLVTDGYYEQADDPPPTGWGGSWIAALRVDWERGSINWSPLCRHGSDWDSQDSHPHPVFNHGGQSVLFTSNRDGRRAIYRLDGGALSRS